MWSKKERKQKLKISKLKDYKKSLYSLHYHFSSCRTCRVLQMRGWDFAGYVICLGSYWIYIVRSYLVATALQPQYGEMMDGVTPKTSAKGCDVPLITKDTQAYGPDYTRQGAAPCSPGFPDGDAGAASPCHTAWRFCQMSLLAFFFFKISVTLCKSLVHSNPAHAWVLIVDLGESKDIGPSEVHLIHGAW